MVTKRGGFLQLGVGFFFFFAGFCRVAITEVREMCLFDRAQQQSGHADKADAGDDLQVPRWTGVLFSWFSVSFPGV